MGTNRTFNLSVIFTGRFLYVWYVLFAIIMLLMVYNWSQLKSVDEYVLTIYDSTGKIVSSNVVTARDVALNQNYLPVTKSFEPIK